jgi:DNA-binding transcriptional ArsR family regulator
MAARELEQSLWYHFVMSRDKNAGARRRSGPTAKQLVEVAKAVGHPARLRILAMLEGRSLCVCQMTSLLGVAPSTVSGHLNELRRAGLVVQEKHGKMVFYSLNTSGPFADLIAHALALVAGDEAIASDRAIVDRVRAVPVEVLTRARMQLEAVGIRRPRLGAERPARA